MELLKLLETAARGGFLALFLTLWAVGYLVVELRRMRAKNEADSEACAKRVGRLQEALIGLHLWAHSGRGRRKPPDLSHLLKPPDDDKPQAVTTH